MPRMKGIAEYDDPPRQDRLLTMWQRHDDHGADLRRGRGAAAKLHRTVLLGHGVHGRPGIHGGSGWGSHMVAGVFFLGDCSPPSWISSRCAVKVKVVSHRTATAQYRGGLPWTDVRREPGPVLGILHRYPGKCTSGISATARGNRWIVIHQGLSVVAYSLVLLLPGRRPSVSG